MLLPKVVSASVDVDGWETLLQEFVSNGRVEYSKFQLKSKELENFLDLCARYDIQEFANDSRENRLALWINVFNASVIAKILKAYPVKSTADIAGFWTAKDTTIAGMAYSLTDILERVFRQGFRDERALLTLVPGEMSSPPLRPEAYRGDRLTEQLNDQMSTFLTDGRFNQIADGKRKIMLSPVFRHYAKDFLLGYAQSGQDKKLSNEEMAIMSFIRIYIDNAEVKQWLDRRKFKISYLPEDKRLNEAKRN